MSELGAIQLDVRRRTGFPVASPTSPVSAPSPWSGPEHRPRLVRDDERSGCELNDADIHLLGLLAEGLPLEAVGRRLDLSDRTVRRRARSVCDRIGVRAPIQAVAWAARRGLI